jgi:hypothetical protein
MTIDSLRHRSLLFSLSLMLAALAVCPSGQIMAQAAATTATNNAPDPRALEAQHRLMLSHRRRDQIQQNALNNELLTIGTQPSVTDTMGRRRHRPVRMHRSTHDKDVEQSARRHPAKISQ